MKELQGLPTGLVASAVESHGRRCPIGAERVSDAAARMNGTLVSLLLLLALVSPAKWVLLLLASDFAIKVFAGFGYSPLSRLFSRVAVAGGFFEPTIPAAPKRFAAALALAFTLAASVAHYVVASEPLVYGTAGVFLVCTVLEGVFGFCLGCRVYAFMPGAVRDAVISLGR